MSVSDIFQVGKIKADLVQAQKDYELLRGDNERVKREYVLLESNYKQVSQERDALKVRITETEELIKHHQLKRAISLLEQKKNDYESQIIQRGKELDSQLNIHKEKLLQQSKTIEAELARQKQKLEQDVCNLKRQAAVLKQEIVVLEDELLLQSFGFYKPKYDFQNSEIYKAKLEEIRDRQEQLVKNKKAVFCSEGWAVNDSKKEGERMIHDYTKLILRSFNSECDASIINVKFNNIDSIEKKITKAFDVLNKLGQRMSIEISSEYLRLKLMELYLCYEYQLKKQAEKEEQRRIREQMKEEAKLQKEIEEAKAKVEKEEKHFNKAYQAAKEQLEKATTEMERKIIQNELNIIQEKINEVEINKQNVLYREQNTRAGYVYVISNLGSFGKNIYKIGVTRRLDPQERIDELGDASVPFYFDVHAMIFSDDAPSLESALHKAFDSRRLNKINLRREFFNVSLHEIEDVVKRNFNKPVEFTQIAEAEQYRQSIKLMGGNDPTGNEETGDN
ncbi:MAG: DUF4041 domain-containing protein [Anaerohalosphaeraceae bacterium]